MSLNLITQIIKTNYPNVSAAEIELVTKAYVFAEKKLKGQKRGNMNYFDHPMETALMMAKMKMGSATIAATLLHDLMHRTDYTFEQMEKDFGLEVASLLISLEDLRGIERRFRGTDKYVESAKRMFMAVAKDFRVIIIKFAERLNNLEHLETFSEEDRRIMLELCGRVYVPLLGILGIWHLRWRMEDIIFSHKDPEVYKRIQAKVEKGLYKRREEIVNEVRKKVLKKIKEHHIKHCEISSRFKHIASVYRKMQEKQLKFNELYDVFAVRTVVDTVDDCYLMLGVVHSLWRPMPRRVKDYIAAPKPNGYQSLHTTVFTKDGHYMEFQIRTQKMNDEAKYGVAAHFYYKDAYGGKNIPEWINNLIDVRKTYEKSEGLLDKISLDKLTDNIFCYTPRGDIIELPRGATPVDFAYAIHTDLGHQCKKAVINEIERPLYSTLKNNDVVEIIKKEQKRPVKQWLKFVKTQLAREGIVKFYKHNKSGVYGERSKKIN